MDVKKQERKVIHLQIEDRHYYYGSIASLFEDFTKEQLGFSQFQVKNNICKMGEMRSGKCIIRKGTLITKHGGRGKKSEHEEK